MGYERSNIEARDDYKLFDKTNIGTSSKKSVKVMTASFWSNTTAGHYIRFPIPIEFVSDSKCGLLRKVTINSYKQTSTSYDLSNPDPLQGYSMADVGKVEVEISYLDGTTPNTFYPNYPYRVEIPERYINEPWKLDQITVKIYNLKVKSLVVEVIISQP